MQPKRKASKFEVGPEPVVEALLSKLEPIRQKYGEDAFNKALEQAALELMRTESPEIQAIIREAFKDRIDFEELEARKASTPKMDMNQLMAAQLKAQMPGLKTQAQFDAFMMGFNALRTFMNHTFLREEDQASQARTALFQSLDLAEKATELTEKLEEVPEAATSPEADKFKTPPKEYGELEVQQGLLEELSAIDGKTKLQQWYEANKSRFSQVVSPSLRNQLYDAVRAKHAAYPT